MNRRVLSAILVIALACMLPACSCKHEWSEATCTAPRTCKSCGETEGEVIPHEWEDATCTTAKTCKTCGLTEGEAKGHDLVEANYQTGERCMTCGETFGEPVIAEFTRTGRGYQTVDLTAAHGNVYEYTTGVNNGTQAITGEAQVYWAVPMDPTVDSNATAINCYVPEGILPKTVVISNVQSLMENMDGYMWRGMSTTVKFNGAYYIIWGYEDFYSLAQYDVDALQETFKDGNTSGMILYNTFSVEMNGETYDQCQLVSVVLDYGKELALSVFYRVPENYDGCVFSLIDSRVLENGGYQEEDSGNGFSSFENTGHGAGDVYFRLR